VIQTRFNLHLVSLLRQLGESELILTNLGHLTDLFLFFFAKFFFTFHLLIVFVVAGRHEITKGALSRLPCLTETRIKGLFKSWRNLLSQINTIGLLWRQEPLPEWICVISLQLLHRIFKLLALFTELAGSGLYLLSFLALLVDHDIDDLVEVLGNFYSLVVVDLADEVIKVVANLIFKVLQLFQLGVDCVQAGATRVCGWLRRCQRRGGRTVDPSLNFGFWLRPC